MSVEHTQGQRANGRPLDGLRPVELFPSWVRSPLGSALLRQGDTWVLCTLSLEERPPLWRRGTGKGWLTASYALLPGSTSEWSARERRGAGGRTLEIERLIGRALRGAVDLTRLPERTLHVDCDVLQADGGTRTAAITGGWVALALGLRALEEDKRLKGPALVRQVAAVSVGMVDGGAYLDLDYSEDVRADTDMNVVMTADGAYLEAQATAEGQPFARTELLEMLRLAGTGVDSLCEIQREAIHVGS